MTEDTSSDYRGIAAIWLEAQEIKVWSKINIKTKKGTFKGVLIPRGEQGDDKHIVVKLASGYNIGISLDTIIEIKTLGEVQVDYSIPDKKIKKDPKKPTVVLIGTGGTVASKLDYKTGAVIPAFSPQELFNAVPELEKICNLETKQLFQKFSENIEPADWVILANEIASYFESVNPAGVVIAHGTDTLHLTAAALSFMLKNIDRPIVLVGSQRSSDRPSSDAAINLVNSVNLAANSDIAEVCVCMHGTSGDAYNLVHRGTRVRKMHSSRRDAFRTIGDVPIAKIENGKITNTGISYHKRSIRKGNLEVSAELDENVGLIYSYPGMKVKQIEFFLENNYSGLVIAGSGLGHVNQKLIKTISRAKEKNIPIFMTTQCLWGFTGMNVYETGRMLSEAGVIPLFNMLPEVALVKAMWVLGHTKEIPFVKELMQKNLAGEITDREPFDGYLIFQGRVDKRIDKLIQKEK
ncbi:MAG: Glu-tRNA(Gln) amidotransferase subunit GatD [Candidatus Heimdallarchaeota archaeon]|nr:Glu-tRNA(Gln) amidotransferase subunit GatD [Candidatus Heimdallarchaeota archaeon]MBY8993130.1 Glu-tRNA(Gln) amidotransferase subunit GatD [Candidatus Heimdallarchaeota archaeon]